MPKKLLALISPALLGLPLAACDAGAEQPGDGPAQQEEAPGEGGDGGGLY